MKLRALVGISVFWLALSMLSDGLNTLVLPFVFAGLVPDQQQATALGLLTFTGIAAGMLIQPLAGAWSDRLRARWGRRGGVLFGTLLTLLGLLAFSLGSTVAVIAAAYLLVQVFASTAQAAQQGFIPDLVPQPQRGRASGWKGMMDLGGAMLGFALLGQLLSQTGKNAAVLAIALAFTVTCGLTLLLVREPRQAASGAGAAAAPEEPRSTLQGSLFFRLVAARFLFLLGTYAVGRFLLLFVASRLGLSVEAAAAQAGALLAALSLVTLLAAVPAGWAADRFGRPVLMTAGVLLSAVGILGLSAAAGQWGILAGGGVMALGSAAFSSANWAMAADIAPAGAGGKFMGLANIGTAGASAAAGLFGPLVDAANRASPNSGFLVVFGLAALITLSSLLVLRPLRRLMVVQNASRGEAWK